MFAGWFQVGGNLASASCMFEWVEGWKASSWGVPRSYGSYKLHAKGSSGAVCALRSTVIELAVVMLTYPFALAAEIFAKRIPDMSRSVTPIKTISMNIAVTIDCGD